MMYKIDIEERVLHFKQPAGTSRGVYTERRIWLVTATDGVNVGMGECAPLPDLSCDALPPNIYNNVLRRFCDEVEQTGTIPYEALRPYPSMLFGLETALLSLEWRVESGEFLDEPSGAAERAVAPLVTDGTAVARSASPLGSSKNSTLYTLHSTLFAKGKEGIPINGLVWMGTYEEMLQRIEEKLRQGFRCIKLKIGAIAFDDELQLIKHIRQRFSHREVELRVDANGAFGPRPEVPSRQLLDDALYKLELLSQYALHSIEQPIRAGQWANMAELCRESPLPIALDEELIGINDAEQKRQMLNIIRPAYIVLKPSLHGGMAGCREWIDTAHDMGIGSWITSALESNVGLNAIAQFCADVYGPGITMPQGLGTGQLFTDNIPMPIEIRGDKLWVKKIICP